MWLGNRHLGPQGGDDLGYNVLVYDTVKMNGLSMQRSTIIF